MSNYSKRLAISLLRMSDASASYLYPFNALSKEEARAVLRTHGWTDERIRRLEDHGEALRTYH